MWNARLWLWRELAKKVSICLLNNRYGSSQGLTKQNCILVRMKIRYHITRVSIGNPFDTVYFVFEYIFMFASVIGKDNKRENNSLGCIGRFVCWARMCVALKHLPRYWLLWVITDERAWSVRRGPFSCCCHQMIASKVLVFACYAIALLLLRPSVAENSDCELFACFVSANSRWTDRRAHCNIHLWTLFTKHWSRMLAQEWRFKQREYTPQYKESDQRRIGRALRSNTKWVRRRHRFKHCARHIIQFKLR